MDSEGVKKAVMRQALQETTTTNVQILMDAVNTQCFKSCVPKPGSSLSKGEKTCMTQCLEKYMDAWNVVHGSYVRRLQQEMANSSV